MKKIFIILIMFILFAKPLFSESPPPKLWEMPYNEGFCIPMGVATDSQNNAVVTGWTAGAGIHTIKYNSLGAVVWSNDYPSPPASWVSTDVAIDSSDDILVVGAVAGGSSGFILKYLADGTESWIKTYDVGFLNNASVAVDSNDNYIVFNSSSDVKWFMIKYDKDGNELWSKETESFANPRAYPRAVIVDSADNIILAGYAFIGGGSTTDICLIKYDSGGNLIWGPIIYDSGDYDYANTVCVDNSDNIYLAGSRRISSVDYLYLRKYDANGNFVIDKTETSFKSVSYGVVVQNNERILIAGYINDGASKDYIAAYTLDCTTKLWDIAYDSSNGTDQIYSIAVDRANNIVVACNNNWSYLTIKYGNNIPPAAITDLGVVSVTMSFVELAWTAPGADGSIGTVSQYDLRYDVIPITDANWGTATQAAGEPVPEVSGTLQHMTVGGLNASTNYYFAIKSVDEGFNISNLSNVVSALTKTTDASSVDIVDVDDALVYPNPYIKGKSSEEKINFNNLPKKCAIRIYTLYGRIIQTIEHEQNSDGGNEKWDINDIPSGIYVYTIMSSGKIKKGKINIIK